MEQLIERVAKAPLGAKVAVLTGILLAVTLLNYFVIGFPTFGASVSDLEARIQRSEVEQKKLDGDYIEKTAIANNLNQFRRERELLEQRLADALAELPNDKNLDELLQSFQDRAMKAGVEIQTIEPQALQPEGFYARVPIPMTVQGNYHEIATFLDSLGRLRRIVNVSNLSFESPKESNGKLILTSRLLATTFMFLDSKDAKKAAGAAKP
jgi:type IV pilus assembly protein PilO